VYDVQAPVMFVRDFNLVLVKEFCRAFSNALACNLHVKLEYGEEPHHVAEAIFKALARALDVATQVEPAPRTCSRAPRGSCRVARRSVILRCRAGPRVRAGEPRLETSGLDTRSSPTSIGAACRRAAALPLEAGSRAVFELLGGR